PRELLPRMTPFDERQRLPLHERPHTVANDPLLVAEKVRHAVVVEIRRRHRARLTTSSQRRPAHRALRSSMPNPTAAANGSLRETHDAHNAGPEPHAYRDAEGVLRRRRDAQLLDRRVAELRHAVGGEPADPH